MPLPADIVIYCRTHAKKCEDEGLHMRAIVLAESAEEIERLRDALRDAHYVATTRDNYGPGTRTQQELQARMGEIQSIAEAALSHRARKIAEQS